jgi:hypothetical protein
MHSIDEQLRRLELMVSPELQSEWLRLVKTQPPCLSAELMRFALAYRLQERTLGGMKTSTARELSKRAGRAKPRVGLKPGTRLVRSWNGRTIDVLVTAGGYLHEEQTYRSLSHVAREVTGTSWSGPRFFGVKISG